jgi:hypothetical protein
VSDHRTDPLSAAARLLNDPLTPVAPFLASLSTRALSELGWLCAAEANRRRAEVEATRCDHPPKPLCDACVTPETNNVGHAQHLDDCTAQIAWARVHVYHPRARVRAVAAEILDRARRAGAIP